MFKYVKFEKVETELTVLEFKSTTDEVKVNRFDVDVVSLEADDTDAIDALISAQAQEISCTEITHDEFKELVADTAQLQRIREVVKEKIAQKYDIADEIAMNKRDATDEKRVAYEAYVQECLAVGYGLKAAIGY